MVRFVIRTAGYDIISTNRGYVINNAASSRTFKVHHTDEQIEDCEVLE